MPNRSIYYQFEREAWRRLAAKTPLPLTTEDVRKLASLGDPIDIAEADAIYRPLSALLEDRFEARRKLAVRQREFFEQPNLQPVPFIIGIAGSVAVGKSTTARLLRQLLSRTATRPKVDLITTDGFLLPNAVLEKRGIMARKGFPESYDRRALLHFLSQVKAGEGLVKAPVYSHINYDVVPGKYQLVDRPDILIVEGINVLQPARLHENSGTVPDPKEQRLGLSPGEGRALAISDFFDFSIYVDARTDDIAKWYVERFLHLKQTAFENKNSYFQVYAGIPDQAARQIAIDIWNSVNLPNLKEQIRPTRGRATLIIRKDHQHRMEKILLRKI